MRVVLPIHEERISPVLDVARQFLVLEMDRESEVRRREVRIESTDLVARARRIAELGSHVVICGAVSWPLEVMLASAGVRVIPNTCGSIGDVVAAFMTGNLTEQAFLMPGCTGRRHRHRHRGGSKW
jgi:predicted Fe-Mo cluster-binding NifX family protein